MGKTATMRLWEIDNGHQLEEIMAEASEIGFAGVAEKYGIKYSTLMVWKRRLGVTTRQMVVIPGAGK